MNACSLRNGTSQFLTFRSGVSLIRTWASFLLMSYDSKRHTGFLFVCFFFFGHNSPLLPCYFDFYNRLTFAHGYQRFGWEVHKSFLRRTGIPPWSFRRAALDVGEIILYSSLHLCPPLLSYLLRPPLAWLMLRISFPISGHTHVIDSPLGWIRRINEILEGTPSPELKWKLWNLWT